MSDAGEVTVRIMSGMVLICTRQLCDDAITVAIDPKKAYALAAELVAAARAAELSQPKEALA